VHEEQIVKRLLRCGALVATAGLLFGVPSAGASAPRREADVAVIVQAPGAEAAAQAAVHAAGGTVTRTLPIVSGFAATVPAGALRRLAAAPGVRAVTRDVALRPAAKGGGGGGGGGSTAPKSVYRTEIGSDSLAKQGSTGSGIAVALIDTGVDTQVAADGDLKGRIVPVADPYETAAPPVACINFSGEDTCDDTFGHGTFMAGLIAGSGAASGGRYTGTAPDVRIVSVKVGGRDGSADVSKVLAGIQWVVSFASDYNIRVLNLSLGTDSTAPTSLDPLNLAVQRAWSADITVVVSAGNNRTAPRGRHAGHHHQARRRSIRDHGRSRR
jgi:serine protease AprX